MTNLVPILLQMCFLLLFIAFKVRIVHQRPLCFRTLSTKLLNKKLPTLSCSRQYPNAELSSHVFSAHFISNTTCHTHANAIKSDSYSHSVHLLGTLHPNTSGSASNAHFLRLSQSTQSAPSSRFLVQTNGFAFEKWFSIATQRMHNFAHNFMLKCCSFQMPRRGCTHGGMVVLWWVVSKNSTILQPLSTKQAFCASVEGSYYPSSSPNVKYTATSRSENA